MKGIGIIPDEKLDDFAGDLEIADQIIKRARDGRRLDRIFHADDIAPFLRAYVLMRAAAQEAGIFMAQLKEREEDGMKVHNPVRK